MAGTVMAIYSSEGSVPTQQICATSFPHVARAYPGKSNGGAACAIAHFCARL